MAKEKKSQTVSVVIPTRDRFDFLKRAIESVLKQTYPIECICIVFDGTPIGDFGLKNSKLKLFTTNETVGASAARNIGLKHVSTDFIAFLDDDDEWLPTKIEEQVLKFQNNSKISIVGCGYIRASLNYKEEHIFQEGVTPFESIKLWNVVGSCSFPLLRTAQVKKLGGFDPTLKSCQDWDLWFRITNQFGPAVILGKALAIYHTEHLGRISNARWKRFGGYFKFTAKHARKLGAFLCFYHGLRMVKSLFDGIEIVEIFSKYAGKTIHKIIHKIKKISYPHPQKTKNFGSQSNSREQDI